jgi:hypothetical protein
VAKRVIAIRGLGAAVTPLKIEIRKSERLWTASDIKADDPVIVPAAPLIPTKIKSEKAPAAVTVLTVRAF